MRFGKIGALMNSAIIALDGFINTAKSIKNGALTVERLWKCMPEFDSPSVTLFCFL